MTKIEWTERTWNPVVGCSVVSPGCTNCYAIKMAGRLEAMATAAARDVPDGQTVSGPLAHYLGTTQPSKAGPVWTGKVALASDRVLTEPLRRRKPTLWFVNSMGDLFHEDVPDAWIDRVFAVMAWAEQHTFQVLTKRSARMRRYLDDKGWYARAAYHLPWVEHDLREGARIAQRLTELQAEMQPLPNVWLGVSAERQQEADARIPDLLATLAAVRFVSAEPLLGPIDFRQYTPRGRFYNALCEECGHVGSTENFHEARYHDDADVVCPKCEKIILADEVGRLDWIIVGGESGRAARPMHPDWARAIRDQCTAASVPFFFKQWGEWAPCPDVIDWPYDKDYDRTTWFDEPVCVRPAEAGWSDKYHTGHCRAQDPILLAPYGGSLFKTPEYLDQVSRCPQDACRAAGKCQGNAARQPSRRVGKRAAGRLLDGREWNEWPATPQRAEAG